MLLLKLILTPLLIAAVTLAGRRWGPATAGWLTGLPLTSGPVSVFLALENGRAFAAQAAWGTLAGLIGVGAFCGGYAASARLTRSRLGPSAAVSCALASGVAAFAVATGLLAGVSAGSRLLLVAVVAAFLAAVTLLIRFLVRAAPREARAMARPEAPAWELPFRMIVATGLVLGLTGLAPVLGARLTGLLSPLPVFAGVLAVFTHRLEGEWAVQRLLGGTALGSFAFAAFFAAVGALLPSLGLLATYAMAAGIAALVQGSSRPAVRWLVSPVPVTARTSASTASATSAGQPQ